MKSATPRTDAAMRRACGPSVSVDFARKLECELNVANAERDALKVEYESRVIWIDKMLDILGCKNPDGFNCKDPHLEAKIIVKERNLYERQLAELKK